MEYNLTFFYICETGAYSTAKKGKEDKNSIRPPSFTDRILCHSQPGSKNFLKIQKYDMCDAIMPSDHRPVAAAIDILVKDASPMSITSLRASRSVSSSAEDSSSPSVSLPLPVRSLPENTRLTKIRIYNIQIRLVDPVEPPSAVSFLRSETLALSRSKSTAPGVGRLGPLRDCMVYFPLQSEDPLAPLRKAVLMDQALNGTSSRNKRFLTAKNMQYIHSFKVTNVKDQILELRSLVCAERSR